MPKTKNTKRAREAAPAAPAKEDAPSPPKKTKFELGCDVVAQALEAADLPEACRAMLLALIPGSLGTPLAERQQLQTVAVNLLEEALARHKTALEQAITLQEQKVQEFEGGKDALEAKAKEAESELESMASETEAKKQVLAAASQEVLATKRAAEDAKSAQTEGDAAYSDAVEDKKAVEEALTAHFAPLKEGNWEAGQAKGHIDALLPLCKRIKLDASLVSAVPSSCTKKPSERGQFDLMVVQQLEETLQAKVVSCTELIDSEGPAAKARAEAAEAAQKAAEASKEKQQQAAAQLFDSQNAYKQKAAMVQEAKASIENFEPNFQAARDLLEVRKATLDTFIKKNMAAFETLRDGAPPSPAKEPEVEAATVEVAQEAPPAPSPAKSVSDLPEAPPALAVGGQ